MSNQETPKLYIHKPKKAQLKKHHKQQPHSSPSPASSSSSMATQTTAASSSSSSTPPVQPPKESLARRYKFLWPVLLAVNFSIGGYLFMRTKKKESPEGEVPPATSTTTPATISTTSVHDQSTVPSPLPEPVKRREPIPMDQQRELLKWILEEKRKVKPKNPEEKKRIDEEKAILKQFIRAKSIPSL